MNQEIKEEASYNRSGSNSGSSSGSDSDSDGGSSSSSSSSGSSVSSKQSRSSRHSIKSNGPAEVNQSAANTTNSTLNQSKSTTRSTSSDSDSSSAATSSDASSNEDDDTGNGARQSEKAKETTVVKSEAVNKNDQNSEHSDDNSERNDEDENEDSSNDNEDYNEANEQQADDDEEDDMEQDQEFSKSSSDDDEDYEVKRKPARTRKPPPKRPPAKKKKNRWSGTSDEESDISPSNSEDDYVSDHNHRPRRRAAAIAASKKKASKLKNSRRRYSSGDDSDSDNKRSAATRRAAAAVSYKEASEDEKTDSEDLIDVDYDESSALPAQDESEKSETIERVLERRIGKCGDTGNRTTIYAKEEPNGIIIKAENVDDAAIKVEPNENVDGAAIKSESNDNNAGKENEGEEEQYLIKWKGWSHIHNTWESEKTLRDQKVKGIKKLENYIKKEQEISNWRKYTNIEDIDYFECQLELQQELLKSYNNVERIIAETTKPEGGIDLLCKWECLPYSDATWEDAGLVEKRWPEKITEFREREASTNTPSRHCRALKSRPKFHHVKSQPDYMGVKRGLVLRDYQMDGLNWLILTWCKDNSVILADEMGLGKTIQTICFLNYLFKSQSLHGPFLCVVPLSTMTAWQREFAIWAPEMNIVTYLGDVQSREIIRQYEWCFDSSNRLKFNAILTTYEILLKDKAFLGCISWAALLVDEAHRLKNDDSLLYKALYDFETNHRLLITGTPLQNSLKELWALLHFIMPEKFPSWEEFEQTHENAAEKGYARLHKQLEPFILRRVKKDVEKSLPAKVEQILRVEMTSIQKQYYKWILTKNFDALRKGSKGSMSTFLNIVIELKKCCNHAMLIRQSDYEQAHTQEDALGMLLKGSGKLVLLDKLLCRLRETGHRVLIFSQMVRMLDILAEYLQKRHFPFQRLDGSIKGEIRKQALDHFNAEGSQDFCFLLSTRAGGLGINLATADTVIIFDSDWNPQNDLQAQARAHRIGQKNQVNIYRLVTARSVEEEIVERAKQKMVLDHLVIQRMDTTGRTVLDKNSSSTTTPFNKDDLSAILKFGAEELFKDEGEGDGDDLVCDIDEILRRAETRDEGPALVGDELLSAFKVASFAAFDEDDEKKIINPAIPNAAYNKLRKGGADADAADSAEQSQDWEEIIPENFRKAVEEEIRHKEMKDLYLPPRRKTLQQINQQADGGDGKHGKKRRKQSDEDSDDESGSDDDRPRKRGRPSLKEKFCNFTDAELRRFIKSYKKFPVPLKRLEAIACDAELQEKPLADLKKIGEMLQERCVAFMEEHKDQPQPGKGAAAAVTRTGDEENADSVKKRGARGNFSMKFGGVSFNARTLMSCVEELAPLDKVIPSNPDERLKWLLEIKTRPANFDVEWKAEDDSRLLCGIYQYGIGSWEAMKMDPKLGLADKIQTSENKKPQAKHLQSRSEYLLKIIRKNLELKKGLNKVGKKKQRKTKETKAAKSKDIIENDNASSEDEKKKKDSITKHSHENDNSTDKTSHHNHHHHNDETSNGPTKEVAAKKGKNKGHKEQKKAKKKTEGPMHFTANSEPRALDVLGDLDPTIFNECKEKMRPVKKALKALDNPDQSLTPEEQVSHTCACLISIGKQIDECLSTYKEPEKIKEWQSNLWYFVSKFTEFDAKKLFKLYKRALKRSEEAKSTAASNSNSPTKNSHAHKNDGSKNTSINATSNSGKGKDKRSLVVDAVSQEKRERKEKKKMQRDRERREKDERNGGNNHDADGNNRGRRDNDMNTSVLDNGRDSYQRDESTKRRLEEGEIEQDSNRSHKRMHSDHRNNRDRDKEDRKRWNDDHDNRIRRNSGNQSQTMPPHVGANPPPRVPMYPDSRDGRPIYGSSGNSIDSDRWSSRDRFSDHKRDHFDNKYNRPQHGYHHRDRDRDRNNQRRYPAHMGYPSSHSHYPPPAYYDGAMTSGASEYRGRYASDWNREREREYAAEYRREYSRPPAPSSSGAS